MTLEQEVRSLVRKSACPHRRIAEDLKISESWLEKFLANKFDDYGIRRLERLRAYLKRGRK